MKNKNHIVLLYVIIGCIWVVLSDQIIAFLIDGMPVKDRAIINSLKGFIFIGFSALLLHYLVNLYNKGKKRELSYLQQDLENSRKQQQQWYYAQKMAKVAGWEYFLQTDEVIWSDNLYALFGLEPNAAITPASFFLEQIHPDDLAGFLAQHDKTVIDGEMDYIHRLKIDNEWHYVRHAGTVVYQDGKPYKISGVLKDINDTFNRELMLNNALERYELVNKATHDAIWDWDLMTNQVTWNSGLQQLFGYDHQPGFAPEWWMEKMHPSDSKRVIDSLRSFVKQAKKRWDATYRVLCADGTYRYVFDQAYLLTEDDGKPKRIIGAVKDIDDLRKRDEENKQLADVVSKVKSGVVIKDTDAKISWVNSSFEQLSGYTLDELKGKLPLDLLYGPETKQVTKDFVTASIQENDFFNIEIINYSKSGNPYWVEVHSTPIFDAEDRHSGYIDIVTEITERKKREEQINEQNQTLKEIAWIYSHEIRKPVASILGLSSLIEITTDQQEKEEYYKMINSCVKEMDLIIYQTSAKVNELMGKEPDHH
ncbi:PAS domain S-box-containing protein [Pedobacter cryoconitis]|uniref:PAS domain-containing protein n=1 Tax=Pedobacter cryoconitis TaxID=188932 RepID=UPI0016211A12|nr:PAS domain-containing protein [Pedobacter cryoconitis]MBB6274553.1 PAS domain S-box-containing protein [Pedobacter cryoconitis]